jgi:hypothetical protein
MIQILLRQGNICGEYPSLREDLPAEPGPLLKLASTLGHIMCKKEKADWKKVSPNLLAIHQLARNGFMKISNNWYTKRTHQLNARNTLCIATDARPHIIAWIIFDSDGHILRANSKQLQPALEISLAEATAIEEAWLDAESLQLLNHITGILTGVDNTVASRCMAKQYSCIDEMNEIVTRSRNIPSRHRLSTFFVDLHTDLNVADIPTREEWTTEGLNSSPKRELTHSILSCAMGFFNNCDINWMSRSAVEVMRKKTNT